MSLCHFSFPLLYASILVHSSIIACGDLIWHRTASNPRHLSKTFDDNRLVKTCLSACRADLRNRIHAQHILHIRSEMFLGVVCSIRVLNDSCGDKIYLRQVLSTPPIPSYPPRPLTHPLTPPHPAPPLHFMSPAPTPLILSISNLY